MKATEYNFDGLVGPTHNYAGLSFGNIASMKNKSQTSKPQFAALEGLEKMKFLMDRGFKQAIWPPQARPDLRFLKRLGFSGSVEKILRLVWDFSPELLASCYSSSNMWMANSAVVSPQSDTEDHKTHFTPANLQFHLHRSLEALSTHQVLKKIFADSSYFVHHPPLPAGPAFFDEGAANHSRFCSHYSSAGVELFVYGKEGFNFIQQTKKFPPRQSQMASKIIALHHKLKTRKTVFAQQNPEALDLGAFHNDVVCVGDQNLIFCHELAFIDTKKVLKELEKKLSPVPLLKIIVREKDISLSEAVSSYLFNSQLLPLKKNQWLLLAPTECEEIKKIRDHLYSLTKNSPIKELCFVPVRQSMKNGGGPSCLRLRVVLTKEEQKAIHSGLLLTKELYTQLKSWIKKHYRDRLSPKDLLDPALVRESETALDELSQILGLKNIYPFQSD